MKSLLYRWFWEGRRKWLVSISFVSMALWLGAYSLIYYWVPNYCVRSDDACFDFWLETLGAPFFAGDFLKALILAPLLVIPFSKLTFRVWALFSLFAVPFAFYEIIFLTPLYGTFFDKLDKSNFWGWACGAGTLAIILVVPLAEWLYKKYKS